MWHPVFKEGWRKSDSPEREKLMSLLLPRLCVTSWLTTGFSTCVERNREKGRKRERAMRDRQEQGGRKRHYSREWVTCCTPPLTFPPPLFSSSSLSVLSCLGSEIQYFRAITMDLAEGWGINSLAFIRAQLIRSPGRKGKSRERPPGRGLLRTGKTVAVSALPSRAFWWGKHQHPEPISCLWHSGENCVCVSTLYLLH